MIQANELRIGNWVKNKYGDIGQVDIVWLRLVTEGEIFKPIPLTEEILLKCGFEKCNDLDCWYKTRIRNDWTNLNVNIKHEMVDLDINTHTCVLGSMKYLHQLQNLYFALTSQELTINF